MSTNEYRRRSNPAFNGMHHTKKRPITLATMRPITLGTLANIGGFDMDEENFAFNVEDLSFVMVNGKLSVSRARGSERTYDRTRDSQVYELAIAYEEIHCSDAAELQQVFDLRWKADQLAIKRWREAHPGSDLVWPDHTDMVVWLMEQLES